MDFSQLPKMSKTTAPPRLPSEEPRPAVAPAVNDMPPPAPARPPSPSPSQPEPRPSYVDYAHPGPPAASSIWISLIVGLICLMLGWSFARYLIAVAAGKPFETGVNWVSGDKAGQPVTYFELQGGTAWTDLGFFSMGVALILDAALMLLATRRPIPNQPLVMAALAVTGFTLLLNLGLAGYLLTLGIMPIASMLLILVGGFVLFDQVPMLKRRSR